MKQENEMKNTKYYDEIIKKYNKLPNSIKTKITKIDKFQVHEQYCKMVQRRVDYIIKLKEKNQRCKLWKKEVLQKKKNSKTRRKINKEKQKKKIAVEARNASIQHRNNFIKSRIEAKKHRVINMNQKQLLSERRKLYKQMKWNNIQQSHFKKTHGNIPQIIKMKQKMQAMKLNRIRARAHEIALNNSKSILTLQKKNTKNKKSSRNAKNNNIKKVILNAKKRKMYHNNESKKKEFKQKYHDKIYQKQIPEKKTVRNKILKKQRLMEMKRDRKLTHNEYRKKSIMDPNNRKKHAEKYKKKLIEIFKKTNGFTARKNNDLLRKQNIIKLQQNRIDPKENKEEMKTNKYEQSDKYENEWINHPILNVPVAIGGREYQKLVNDKLIEPIDVSQSK